MCLAFLSDAVDIAKCEEATELICVIHDHQLVDSWMFSKELIRYGDWIIAQLLFGHREDLISGSECFLDWAP